MRSIAYVVLRADNYGNTQPEDVSFSGRGLVLAHTMYAIVGAIALERGGLVANQVAQKRILEPLGLKTAS